MNTKGNILQINTLNTLIAHRSSSDYSFGLKHATLTERESKKKNV